MSASCLGLKTTKELFGFGVNLPTTHISTTHVEGFTLPFLLLNVKQESCDYQFNSLWYYPTENRTRVYRFSSRSSIHSTTARLKNQIQFTISVEDVLANLARPTDISLYSQINKSLYWRLCWRRFYNDPDCMIWIQPPTWSGHVVAFLDKTL